MVPHRMTRIAWPKGARASSRTAGRVGRTSGSAGGAAGVRGHRTQPHPKMRTGTGRGGFRAATGVIARRLRWPRPSAAHRWRFVQHAPSSTLPKRTREPVRERGRDVGAGDLPIGPSGPAVGSARCSSSASRAASASGKSTVSALLAAKGAVIIDADAITRELQQPGTEVFDAMVERFGDGIVAPDGTLDRPGGRRPRLQRSRRR